MPNPLHRTSRALVLRALRRWDGSRIAVDLPEGARRSFGPEGAVRTVAVRVRDDRFFTRLLLAGGIGAGESYMAGEWESDDLTALLREAFGNAGRVNFDSAGSLPATVLERWHQRRRANTKSGSERNVHAHYDLGNEFFGLFLDETLTYSCALFDGDSRDLRTAQTRKYQAICEKLALGPDDHVLEIGCGWGGFALHAVQATGCRVTGITISQQQLELARRQAREAGLADRIDIQFRDYRDVEREFDKIVSIEMFEAVGREYWGAFFEACARALKPGGAMLLQTIAIPDASISNPRRAAGWIGKYIFPGGLLPAVAEIAQTLRRGGDALAIRAVEEIGPHYVRTLDEWRRRFWLAIDEVRRLGYDATFVRMWDFYLASSSAAFATAQIRDVQLLLDKPSVAGSAGVAQSHALEAGLA